jgi:hypothetical protein
MTIWSIHTNACENLFVQDKRKEIPIYWIRVEVLPSPTKIKSIKTAGQFVTVEWT